MACTQTLAGLCINCDGSLGGLKKILIAQWKDGIFTVGEGGTVTGVSSGSTWYEYQFRKGQASFSTEQTKDDTNGVNYFTSTIDITFTRMDATKRAEIQALAFGDVAVIAVDSNGEKHCFGVDEPVTSNGGTVAQSGAAKGDGNFYQVHLTDDSQALPLIYSGTLPTPANDCEA